MAQKRGIVYNTPGSPNGITDGKEAGIMFREKYRTYIHWGVTATLVLCGAIAFYFLLLRWGGFTHSFHDLSTILAPISYGLIIAYIMDSLVKTMVRLMGLLPWTRRLNGKVLKWRRGIAIALSMILFLAILSTLVEKVVPQLIDSIRMLISNLDGYVHSLEGWMQPFFTENPTLHTYVNDQINHLEDVVTGFLRNDILTIMTALTTGLKTTGTYVYNFIIGLIVSVYLLSSKERIVGRVKKLVYTVFRTNIANKIMEVGRNANRIFKGFLVGKILDSSIIGALCFVGNIIFGIPYALLIAIVVGVTNLIPYFGPFIGAIPSAFLVLMIDPSKALVFLIFILILQQIDGNLIGPKILGNTTGVSSLGVLISILIGGGLFGVTGMILAVPSMGVFMAMIKGVIERRLAKRGLPTDTETYLKMEYVDMETKKAKMPELSPVKKEKTPEKREKPGRK